MLPPPDSTRLVTIIAHVDHGKTTLADNLVESNGIISERLAGTLRYLDSDAEEQRRGITMRASAIGLRHRHVPSRKLLGGGGAAAKQQQRQRQEQKRKQSSNSSNNAPREMVVHLIDSPGHVDFSAEVTSSLLLCDSAVLVIDAVEGLCARTHSLVREACAHELVPVLVVNKVDRLATELALDPTEAHSRLRELVESVNAVCAAMLNARLVGGGDDDDGGDESGRRGGEGDDGGGGGDDDLLSEIWNFDPMKGNVVFASALHGWGFTVPTLARSLFKSGTVALKPPVLRQYLFGDFRYDATSGRVLKWRQQSSGGGGEGNRPMFAEYALAPLWEIYEGVSQAAVTVGMKSELYSFSGSHNGSGMAPSSDQGGNTKSDNAKIEANTPGMERVVASLRVGSTSPSVIAPPSSPGNDHANDERKLPRTKEELQQILSRIGAGSESSVSSAVLRRYRPLSDAILDAVCETGPSPAEATSTYRTRVLALQSPPSAADDANAITASPSSSIPTVAMEDEFGKIQRAVRQCDPGDGAPTVAHVCKFTSTNRTSVTDPDLPPLPPDADPASANMIMGIARVLSGNLRTEDVEYYMFGPRHANWRGGGDGPSEEADVPKQRIRCYLLMGSSFVRVKSVPAGHICAIYNLEALQLKTVTICDRRECMPLRGFDFGLQPLVKVNVEPVSASDMNILERGLLKLSLADSSVEVTATAKGERILACLGEIHLEQSILDLETIYCDSNIKLRISDPITSFCETTTWFENERDFDKFLDDKSPPLRQTTIPPYCDEEGLSYANKGRCRTILSGRGAAIAIRAIPLPRSVFECLRTKKVVGGSEDDLVTIGGALKCKTSLTPELVLEALLNSLDDIDDNGNALLESPALSKGYSVKSVLSTKGEIYVVPQKETTTEDAEESAPDMEGYDEYQFLQQSRREGFDCNDTIRDCCNSQRSDAVALQKWRQDMRGSALAGFHLAMRAGPVCEEPVRGVAVILETVEIAVTKETSGNNSSGGFKVAKDLSGGMVVAALRSGVRGALLSRPVRLVEGHLRLTLHSSMSGLGPLHAVLSRRRGKVVTDTMVDGTDLIQVTATIPQAESFGLAPEIMKRSSGGVTAPELVFSHWEVLDEDPFWIPTTEEEREDYGQNLQTGDSSTGLDNNALKYIRMVRSRKGLLVDSSKIVVAAEKQRTLSKKR